MNEIFCKWESIIRQYVYIFRFGLVSSIILIKGSKFVLVSESGVGILALDAS